MINVAIFASGNGSNARRLCDHFLSHPKTRISLILTDNPQAGVIKVAKAAAVPCRLISRKDFQETHAASIILKEFEIDFIVLAGFLRLIPRGIINDFQRRIINIHPALLPKYGGKGMYGRHVHEAVLRNRDKISGISIHYVNEQYDEGDVIFQAACTVSPDDTPDTLAERIHELEHLHFPSITEQVISQSFDTY